MALVRLHKWMAEQGIASRRKCEEFIRQRLIKVNGSVVTVMGMKIDPAKDTIELDATLQKKLKNKKLAYIMLNKPKGYVTTITGPEEPKVIDLLKNLRVDGKPIRVFPVGRLDKETSGLLILTNDGRFAYEMTHPKFEKEKEYEVTTPTPISDEALKKLSAGVTIFKKPTAKGRLGYQRKTKPAKITRVSSRCFRIVLTEGMNRQIRRMCRKVGFPYIEIKRIRIGNLYLEDLKVGKWRLLDLKK